MSMSFATAIPVAIKVAGMLNDGYRYVRDHPDEVQRAMDEASKAAAAAKRFAGTAKDALGVDDAVAKARRTAESARQLASEAASARRDETPEEAAARKAAIEAAKAVVKARQAVLESADLRTTLPKLGDRLTTTDDAKLAALMQVLDAPGCFVFATYGKLDLDRDLTDYKGVYVGKAEVVGDGIAATISRAGNPDVYADLKFRQNVVIYAYSCPAEDLDESYEILVDLLGARDSYNMPLAEE